MPPFGVLNSAFTRGRSWLLAKDISNQKVSVVVERISAVDTDQIIL